MRKPKWLSRVDDQIDILANFGIQADTLILDLARYKEYVEWEYDRTAGAEEFALERGPEAVLRYRDLNLRPIYVAEPTSEVSANPRELWEAGDDLVRAMGEG